MCDSLYWQEFKYYRNKLFKNIKRCFTTVAVLCDTYTQLENQLPWDHIVYYSFGVHHYDKGPKDLIM